MIGWPRNRGFTLLEMLVVLVIVGIVAGVAVLSVGVAGPGQALMEAAQQAAAQLGVLSQQATMEQQILGVRVETKRYRVMRYDARMARWVIASGKAAYTLPAGLRMEVTVDAPPAPGVDAHAPQLVFMPDGQMTPFTWHFRVAGRAGRVWHVQGDGFQLPVAQAGP